MTSDPASDDADPTRRALLAGIGGAGLASLTGCMGVQAWEVNPLQDAPVTLTVVRADPSNAPEDTPRCDLPDDRVEEHPVLAEHMEKVAEKDPGARVSEGVSMDRAEEMNALFQRHCDRVGGLYGYADAWFYVGLTFRDQADHRAHHDDSGNTTDHTH